MSHSAKIGFISYEVESAWAENVSTFTTYRLPVLDEVDTSGLRWGKTEAERVSQYRSDGSPHILMTMGGSFRTKMYLTGHGTTAAGAVTIKGIETLLGDVLGVSAIGPAGTTATGGTATVVTTTSSGTFASGGLCRIGALGDGDGNGQMYPIATHSAQNLTLLVDLDGAPVNGAVIYSTCLMYPSVTGSNAITGKRFLLGKANLSKECHGCWPMSITFSGLNAGEKPTVEIEWGVSWWDWSTSTPPSAVATDDFAPAANASGSFFIGTVGTSTRHPTNNLRKVQDLSVTYTLGMSVDRTPGGVNAYQDVTAVFRIDDQVAVSWAEPADANTASPVLGGFYEGTDKKHIMITGNAIDSKAWGMYLRNCCSADPYPVQFTHNGRNFLRKTYVAYVGPTTTNALTLSPFLLGFS
jgi:hypothetical protein